MEQVSNTPELEAYAKSQGYENVLELAQKIKR